MRALTTLAFSALSLTGCACITPAPTIDPSPPTARLTVEFRSSVTGATEAKTVLPGDADVTIDARKDHRVSVLWGGGDDQGMRKVELLYDMRYTTSSGALVTPMLAEISETLSCPKRSIVGGVRNFDPDGNPWRYEFTTRSTNWVGGTGQTAKITVITH